MIHSFLLIGQSNMAGRGFLHETVPVNEEHIKVLRNGRWCNLHRPVHHDRHFSGVCLAESFAEKYAEKYGVDVGLIPCADGGTRLDQWAPGTILFDHAVYMTRLAQRTSTVAGVLWHQGEGDCSPSLRATYRTRFEAMMAEMRRLLDLHDIPFIVGGLGEFLPLRAKEYEQESANLTAVLKEMAEGNPLMGFASAKGLTANPDNLHFNAASLHEFGLRYFEAYEQSRDPSKVFPEKPAVDDSVRTALELL